MGHLNSIYTLGMISLTGRPEAMSKGIRLISDFKKNVLLCDLIKCREIFREVVYNTLRGCIFMYGEQPEECCNNFSHKIFNVLDMDFRSSDPSCDFCLCDMELYEIVQ